jgi:hypothetical protein
MPYHYSTCAYSASAAMFSGDCHCGDCDPEVAASPTPVTTPDISPDTPDSPSDSIPSDYDFGRIDVREDLASKYEFPVATSPDAHASTATGIPSRSKRAFLRIPPAGPHQKRTIVMGSSDCEGESDAGSPYSKGLTVAASPECQGPIVAAAKGTEHAGNVVRGSADMVCGHSFRWSFCNCPGSMVRVMDEPLPRAITGRQCNVQVTGSDSPPQKRKRI